MPNRCHHCHRQYEPTHIRQLYCSDDCRFWSKVKTSGPNECWLFEGSKNRKGYGQFLINGACRHASRVCFELLNGFRLDENQFVCHKCDNPLCVNPRHLFLGTLAENFRDMFDKGRHQRGASHYRAVLDEAQVTEIKELLSSGLTAPHIAQRYGVSKWAIFNIKQGRNWKHVGAT